jgi:pimeloyl-ACP methyl ester carboxylesterase
LIGSAVFDAESSKKVKAIRLGRTSKETLAEVQTLENQMSEATADEEQNKLMARIADLEFDADIYDPLTRDLELMDTQVAINQRVWRDFVKLRDNGEELKRMLSKIRSEVVVVHGDHDPHIIEGIYPFLQSCLPQVRLEWLKNCGHYPWIERAAKDRFYEILIQECQSHEF